MYRAGVSKALSKDKIAFAHLESAFSDFKSTKELKVFRKEQKESKGVFESIVTDLKLMASESKDSGFAGHVTELCKTLVERTGAVTSMIEHVVEFLNEEDGDRNKLTKMLHEHDEKMVAITKKLNGHVSKMRF